MTRLLQVEVSRGQSNILPPYIDDDAHRAGVIMPACNRTLGSKLGAAIILLYFGGFYLKRSCPLPFGNVGQVSVVPSLQGWLFDGRFL